MNNMKSKARSPDRSEGQRLRNLSMSVGDFIRYWGFRRIHGAIWTQLYLSKTPLSCKELTERLGVSKALVSPALDELCGYKLIVEAPAPNEKTKLYFAAPNINEVIQHILRTREAKILKKITEDYAAIPAAKSKLQIIDEEKLNALGEMIVAANVMLEIFLTRKDLLKMHREFDEIVDL